MKKIKIVSLSLAAIIAVSSLTAFKMKPAATMSPQGSVKGLTIYKASNPSKSPAAAKSRKNTLVIGTEAFTYPYNFPYVSSTYDQNACYLMYDLLIDNNDSAKAIPNAATWTVSKNNLTYTFKLKKGIKFWNGHKATATDVAFYFYLIDDPTYDGQQNLAPDNIKGWKAYNKGTAKTISGIKVVNPQTISITMTKPNAAAIFDLGSTPIMEKKYFAPNFKRGDAKKVEASNKAMGTGPYKLKKYKEGQELDLTRNTNYWKGKVKIPNVIFSVTAAGQELQRLQAGEVDVEDEVPVKNDNINSMKNSKFLTGNLFPDLSYSFMQFQVTNKKFSDYRVRQALTYALDRDGIIKATSNGFSKVIDIPESVNAWDYTTKGITHYNFNITKANQLLDKAGWKRGSDGFRSKNGTPLSVDFAYTPGSKTQSAIAAGMKQSYLKVGVKVTLDSMDWGTLNTKAEKNQLECYCMGWTLTLDPNASNNIFTSTGSQNFEHYKNKTIDKLFPEGLAQLNQSKRKAIYAKIYKILNTELAEVPLDQPSKIVIYNARIKNFHATTYVNFYDKLWTYSLS